MALDRRMAIGIGVSAAHFALQLATLFAAFSMSMQRFDTMAAKGTAETLLTAMSAILAFPIVWAIGLLPKSILNSISGMGMAGSIIGYIPYVLNSAVWGIAAIVAYDSLKKRK
ncbi:MAG: hypothetical protein HY544_04355 [Candidatus Diapherotrites archaeon]|uniref:Uncharacterized protein n=1 Tax=Candidatus Iainarchaeum sp. TaxID=3101447 RepID=A0A8T3YNX0_9ARCH|nr:hypothetical protein [Candidatus Diapherotrites archaeon]